MPQSLNREVCYLWMIDETRSLKFHQNFRGMGWIQGARVLSGLRENSLKVDHALRRSLGGDWEGPDSFTVHRSRKADCEQSDSDCWPR